VGTKAQAQTRPLWARGIEGHSALVTGAGRGLGRACALALSQAGARVIAFARSAGIDPELPVIAATMGASLGFLLPVSTPCNAIVYGTGRVPLRAMMRHGLVLDAVGVVVIVAVVGMLGPLVIGR